MAGSDRGPTTTPFGLCCALMLILAVHDCGAQNLAAVDRMIDSVANPPLDRNEALRFEREEIDGIRLSDTDAPVRYEFCFRNEGSRPLVITRVAASCGCTVAEFDRRPVPPGREGTVAVLYKPAGESGRFRRNLFVYTDASSAHPSGRLSLSGEVTAQQDCYDGYPAVMGELRCKRAVLSFGPVSRGETRTERIECVNAGEQPLRLHALTELLPEWISFRTEPEVIAPGATADLAVTLRGDLIPADRTGRMEEQVLIEGLDCPPSRRMLEVRWEIQ